MLGADLGLPSGPHTHTPPPPPPPPPPLSQYSEIFPLKDYPYTPTLYDFIIIIKDLRLKLGDIKRFLQYTPAATAPSPDHVRCDDEVRCDDVLVLCDIPKSADRFDVSHIEYVRPIHQLETAFKVAGESVGVRALFDSAAAMSAETKVHMCSVCLLARVPFPMWHVSRSRTVPPAANGH